MVDQDTGRGVPLVELRTTNGIACYTDSHGIVVFSEPALMNQTVYFHIRSHGYEFPKDGFGNRGQAFKIVAGGNALVKIKRINIAERLYRMTGEGIYFDQTSLNGLVMGQDSDLAVPYRGKIYWFFGDTNRPSYPLGNFGTSGATSAADLDPDTGVDLTYFIDKKGFSRPMLPMAGPGPKWLSGLMVLDGRLIGKYDRIQDLGHPYERALAVFNDDTETFEKLLDIGLNSPLHPDGHPVRVSVNGVDYYYFSFSPPFSMRVRADQKHVMDLKSYEGFTCSRDSGGRLVWSWKTNTRPVDYKAQKELIKAGKIKPEEAWFQFRDIETGAPIDMHAGSVYWNAFRKRWIMIGEQTGGTSNLGEIWFAEADTIMGPWVYARKIVTHDRYSFYNPAQHPFFDSEGGRSIYFSGTYASTFSGNPEKTPRYDYNIIMYRLALDDPRLALPVPVYRLKDGRLMMREQVEKENAWEQIYGIAHFALPGDPKRTWPSPVSAAALDWEARPVPGHQQ